MTSVQHTIRVSVSRDHEAVGDNWPVALPHMLESDARALLAELPDTPCCHHLKGQIKDALAKLVPQKADWLKRAVEAAEANLPVLEQAQAEGTYVSNSTLNITYASVKRGPRAGLPAASDFWLGTQRVLEARGIRTQIVVNQRTESYSVMGYRLAPEGDTRQTVDINEVFPTALRPGQLVKGRVYETPMGTGDPVRIVSVGPKWISFHQLTESSNGERTERWWGRKRQLLRSAWEGPHFTRCYREDLPEP